MSTFSRYLLYQIPLTALVAIALGSAFYWQWLSLWPALGLLAVWVGKDLFLYPYLRTAYERDTVATGAAAMVGLEGRACEPLAPEGYVLVRGERWRAQARSTPLEAGAPVTVVGAEENLLLVEAVAGEIDAP